MCRLHLRSVSILCILCSVVHASASPVAHNVILSWKPPGQPWHFAFFSTLPLPYSASDLNHPREVVVGIPALKQRLARQSSWRHIAWRDFEEAGKQYPLARIRDEIQAFAKKHGVFVEIVPTIYD
jgi:hypothetical protein